MMWKWVDPDATGYPARLLVHGDVCGRILKRRLRSAREPASWAGRSTSLAMPGMPAPERR